MNFKRKPIMSILFLVCGAMILFTGLLKLMTDQSGAAFFQIFVALIFVYDAYVYIRPYLGLNDEQLIVYFGLMKKEIISLNNISALDEKNKTLIITFKQGSTTKRLKILLSHLKKQDRELFLKELKLKLGKETVALG